MRTIRPDEDAGVAQMVDDVRCLGRCRFERFPAAYELDAYEETRAAHVADERVVVEERAQPRKEMTADFVRVRLQALVEDDAQHLETDRARHRVAAERAEEFHPVVERRGNLGRGDDGANRM